MLATLFFRIDVNRYFIHFYFALALNVLVQKRQDPKTLTLQWVIQLPIGSEMRLLEHLVAKRQ